MNKKLNIFFISFFIFLLHFTLSYFLLSDFLNSDISFKYFFEYNVGDISFLERALVFSSTLDPFKAFGDLLRLPVYPIFLSLFFSFSKNPIFLMKLSQLIIASLIVPLFFITIIRIVKNIYLSFLFATIVGIWLPFYFFSVIFIVEQLNIFLVFVIIFLLSTLTNNKVEFYKLATLGFIVALLTLSKSNNILLIFPTSIFIAYISYKTSFRLVFNRVFIFFISIVPFLIVWSFLMSMHNDRFVLFSTEGPKAMLYGMGLKGFALENTLAEKYARELRGKEGIVKDFIGQMSLSQDKNNCMIRVKKFIKENNFNRSAISEDLINCQSYPLYSLHNILTNKFKYMWSTYPIELSKIGLMKIGHGFGLSHRDYRDIVFSLFYAGILLIFIFLLVCKIHLKWLLLFSSSFFIYILQAFLIYGDQKYRIILLDPFAFIILSLFLNLLYEKYFKKIN